MNPQLNVPKDVFLMFNGGKCNLSMTAAFLDLFILRLLSSQLRDLFCEGYSERMSQTYPC